MAFDLTTWKTSLTEHLAQSKTWLKRAKDEAGPYILYGNLCGLSLWPLVTAALESGQLVSVVLALGSVAGGAGSSLIATQMQRWVDSKADVSEADVTAWVQEQLADNTELREALDTLLEKLEVIPEAQAALPVDDRAWFAETLRDELTALGTLNRFEAHLSGGGVITQESIQIAGERSVVGAAAQENIITGNNNTVNRIVNLYLKEEGQELDEGTLRQQMFSYLKWVYEEYGTIELRGVKREGEQVVGLDLETVYVPLAAQTYRHSQPEEIALDQVLTLGERVVVTGGPGSGKTTVLLHLARILSEVLLSDDAGLAETQLGLPQNLPLPLLVPLSAYAFYLRHLKQDVPAEDKTLAAFISRYQIEKQTSFELPDDFFQQLLRQGLGVMLLLDGLDEVPNEAERVQVRQGIEDLVTGRDQMRVVVTCRTAAYQERTALGKGFQEVKVQPLDSEHLEALVRQACGCLYHHDQERKVSDLLAGITKLEAERRRLGGEDIEPLVTSPLMVRLLLIVHYSERRLPDQRAELYMKATDAMLLPDYGPDEVVADQIGGLVGGNREVHRELVQHVAFHMHQRGETQGKEVDETELRAILAEHPTYANLADDFIGLTLLRGTLLTERLGMYSFLHLSFQEFLSARYLAEIVRSEAGINGIAAFLEAGSILETWWREPALLTAGYLSVTSPQTAQNLLRRWAGLDAKVSERDEALSTDVQLALAEVAATATLEWPGISKALSADLAHRFVAFFERSEWFSRGEPGRRAALGDALARLGDPRPGVTTLEGMEFCCIPAGPFWMGSRAEDELADEDEKPLHQVELPYAYWLARYPVTVGQFQSFVKQSGYTSLDEDSLDGLANEPVRWVSWRDALAFCRWLSQHWREGGVLPAGWEVTLPSEAEWEKGARGGLGVPIKAQVVSVEQLFQESSLALEEAPNPAIHRRYPWRGDEADVNRMNFVATGIGGSSAVGCFPRGRSPYGCEEMIGNVDEWTRSLWGEDFDEPEFGYPYDPTDGREDMRAGDNVRRVVRGGSFFNSENLARCAVRGRVSPDFGDDRYGFRVVVSPITSGP